MKYFALFAVFFSVSASADNLELCKQVREDSYSIMEYRQRGMPMKVQLDTLKGLAMNDVATRLVIVSAYNQDTYSTPEYRRIAADRFSYQTFRDCLKNTKDYLR